MWGANICRAHCLGGSQFRQEDAAIPRTALVHLDPSSPLDPDRFRQFANDGFTGVVLAAAGEGSARAATIAAARAARLRVFVAVEADAFALDDPLVVDHPRAFLISRDAGHGAVDPRHAVPSDGRAWLRLQDIEASAAVLPTMLARLENAARDGIDGIVLSHLERAAPQVIAAIAEKVRTLPGKIALALRIRVDAAAALAEQLADADGAVDFVLVEAGSDVRDVAAIIAAAEAIRPFAMPLTVVAPGASPALAALQAAAGEGVVVADGFDATALPSLNAAGAGLVLAGSATTAPAVLRCDAADWRSAGVVEMVVANPHAATLRAPSADAVAARVGFGLAAVEGFGTVLEPGDVRVIASKRAAAIAGTRLDGPQGAAAAAGAPRIVIEDVTPRVDAGEFPVKRTLGDPVEVEADIFADGHEVLGARLIWRADDEETWQSAPLVYRVNDRWRGSFTPTRLGRYSFAVEAWWDDFGTLRRDLTKKRDAGVAQDVDAAEGKLLLEDVRSAASAAKRAIIDVALAAYRAAGDAGGKVSALLGEDLAEVMAALDQRPHLVRSREYPLDAERLAARFSSWYELFPRSQTDSPERHGTFRDVIKRLPAVRAMGFDTLYFPPIHPIGKAFRKGKNNSTTAAEGEPGSPYAIGSADGGHDAVHPELGTLEDFVALVEAARGFGLEIALDFAIQCSPDHPWLKQHPGWFDWRPDGTIKYAENPPKKYQDIVNVDFYAKDAIPDLWLTLRDIVAFWISKGVTVFRVDNPHTKPFAFWEWMIGDIRRVHPEAIFLAEAFTRPKVMYRLAKVGFSQSYTYFTWRNGKHELAEYLTELSTEAPREFFRPHFFVNTPDINPTFLHNSGPAGFKIRAALAATLSGLFGVYSGFELCEGAPVTPGKEEYLDSEKYELRPRDWKAPGNIIADITLLNRLRQAHPALQTHLGVTFYNAWNDAILYYGKQVPGSDEMILVAVSLDPYHAQEADFEVPLWAFGLPDQAAVDVEDLVAGHRFAWHGKHHHMRIEPDRPYRIWRITPAGGQA